MDPDETDTVLEALAQIAVYREWTTDDCRTVASPTRTQFVWRAESAREVAVALYADYAAADVKRLAREPAHDARKRVSLSPANIAYALERARRLVGTDSRRLVVLLLYGGAVKRTIDSPAWQAIGEARSATLRIEPWHTDELYIDPLQHELVPLQRRATPAEYAAYDVAHLPVMRANDAVARWLGVVPGDVVYSERVSPDKGLEPYFRRVDSVR